MQTKITFLGGGNMANAIVTGLVANGHAPASIYVVDRNADKREKFIQTFGVHSSVDYAAALKDAQIVILAVKPQGFAALLEEIKPLLATRTLIMVSIMSGIRLASLQAALPEQTVLRAMPNTPARAQAGMTLLAAGKALPEQLAAVQGLFNAVGQTVVMPTERAFEELTALTGCGPAFVFYLVDLFAKAMQNITPDVDCLPLAVATFQGALTLMQKEALAPETLIKQVCPKGGMTFEAMNVLQATDLQALFQQTFQAAIARGDALAHTK